MTRRSRKVGEPGWVALCIAIVMLWFGVTFAIDVVASWVSWGPRVTVTVTEVGTGGTRSSNGTGVYQDEDGKTRTVELRGVAVNAGQHVSVTLSPIPWYRGTAFNSPFGPLANGETIAAPLLLLMGGNCVRQWLRRFKRVRTGHHPSRLPATAHAPVTFRSFLWSPRMRPLA